MTSDSVTKERKARYGTETERRIMDAKHGKCKQTKRSDTFYVDTKWCDCVAICRRMRT